MLWIALQNRTPWNCGREKTLQGNVMPSPLNNRLIANSLQLALILAPAEAQPSSNGFFSLMSNKFSPPLTASNPYQPHAFDLAAISLISVPSLAPLKKRKRSVE